MTSTPNGLPNTGSALGFGSSLTGINVTTGIIDDTFLSGTYAFSMPDEGTITSIAAYFSSTTSLLLDGSTITITAEIYTSSTPNNDFTAVPGGIVTLSPALTGALSPGIISNGIATGLSIPVTAQTRVLVAFSINVSGLPNVYTVTGFANAGIKIQ
jgi:BclB C-terminal domain-containing protein